jgi:hypothetical protein
MHYWGDNDFSDEMFAQVGQAADYIGTFLRKWGRVHVSCTKEKYGTARVYCSFGIYNVNTLVYPGYHYIQKPTWLMHLRLPEWKWLQVGIANYQLWLYNLAYNKAFKKFPLVQKEIYYGADYSEFIQVPNDLLNQLLDSREKWANRRSSDRVIELLTSLRAIKGTPSNKDLIKLAKRIKNRSIEE